MLVEETFIISHENVVSEPREQKRTLFPGGTRLITLMCMTFLVNDDTETKTTLPKSAVVGEKNAHHFRYEFSELPEDS